MTGTASVLNDYTDNANKKARNINLLSSWLFGKVNTDCTLVDLSLCGGAVLVPLHQPVPGNSFDLVIMSPENREDVFTTIHAEPRWQDNEFSSTHKKVGFRFKNIDLEKHQDIRELLQLIASQKSLQLECSILNY